MIICAWRRAIVLLHWQQMMYSFNAFDPEIRNMDKQQLKQLGDVSRILIDYNKIIVNPDLLPDNFEDSSMTPLANKLVKYKPQNSSQ